MSSTVEESATTILVSCKQTRFHIETPVYQELDIEALNVTVTSGNAQAKPKGKARAEGLELLTNAKLKLKAGVHYGLLGRNGAAILRAVAEKLIPGIPLGTRISLLQQTAETGHSSSGQNTNTRSVLQDVVERSVGRDDIQQDIDILAAAIESTDLNGPVRGLRNVKHARLKKQLFEMDKDARLRSGARGLQARKALVEFEKRVADSLALVEQGDDDILESTRQEESQEAMDLLTELQAQLEPTRVAQIESNARKILTGLGFPEANFSKPVSTLSGGWHMRCSLATALLQECDILILDEPTNFLDILGIVWLESYLVKMRETSNTTVVLVSHDRQFVNRVCEEIIILRDKTLSYFRGNIDAYEKDQRAQKLYYGRMKEAQDRQKAHMEKTIANNRKAAKASGDENKLRQAKSRQKKLDDRMGLQVSAKGGRFKLNRDLVGFHLTARADIDVPTDEKGVTIHISEAPDLRFPGPLVSLEKIMLKFKSAPAPTLDDVNLSIHMGDRVGILGLNGAGKTTIVRLVTDTIKSSSGTVTRHPRLRLGYYSQHVVEDLQRRGRDDAALTALGALAADSDGELGEGEMRGMLAQLGLAGRTASDVPLSKLSGGQLVRGALALVLWKQPQLLVLDEITTHLDYHTVEALGEALARWNGAVLLVSHDRFFMRRVIEGEKPARDDSEEEDEEDEQEEDEQRRRAVYLLKAGKLQVLQNGVSDFEESLEKRVRKMIDA